MPRQIDIIQSQIEGGGRSIEICGVRGEGAANTIPSVVRVIIYFIRPQSYQSCRHAGLLTSNDETVITV